MKKIILTIGCIITCLFAMGLGYALELRGNIGTVASSCIISFVGFIGYVVTDWVIYKYIQSKVEGRKRG